jgi:hypothetical protein
MPAQRQKCTAPWLATDRNVVPLLQDQESNSRASIELTHLKSMDYDFSAKDHKRLGQKNLSA